MKKKVRSRLLWFLLVSLLLHMILLFSIGRFPSLTREAAKKQPVVVDLMEVDKPEPKKYASKEEIKRFDMMEVKEGSAAEPGSLSKSNKPKTMASLPPPQPSIVAPQPQPPVRAPKEKPREEAKKNPREAPQRKEPRQRASDESLADKKTAKAIEERPRELPSVRDLIPTLRQIYAMQSPGESLYEHPSIVQDGIGDQPARVAYDEYLAEFKSRVKMNWKVTEDPYMHESATVLLIIVTREGRLESLEKLKSSGMPGHDFEAVMAVRNSFPLRSPPEVLLNEEGNLSIHFTFYYHVRRGEYQVPALRW